MYIHIFSYQCGPLRERGRVMGNEKLSTAMAVTFPYVLIGQSTSPGTNLPALGNYPSLRQPLELK